MKQHPTDQELDRLMRGIVRDVSADTSLLDEIAESPTLWWSVQRGISSQKEEVRSPWPPSVLIRRWLLVAVPAIATAVIVISFFAFQPGNTIAVKDVASISVNSNVPVSDEMLNEAVTENGQKNPDRSNQPTNVVLGRKSLSAAAQPIKARHIRKDRLPAANVDSTATKTDFIALSYAGNPDSGQVVRVKVPSSLMVSLGLVSSVEKPTSLIDAEVVVGDDGQTHAIRFIRQ